MTLTLVAANATNLARFASVDYIDNWGILLFVIFEFCKFILSHRIRLC